MNLKENVYDVIKKDGRFTILTKMLEDSGIGAAMSLEEKAFTLFAPTDEAFCRLSDKALNILGSSEGAGVLAAILCQHMIPQNYLYSNDLRKKEFVKNMNGNELKITEESNVLQLEDAHILTPGIAASNAVVFPIDKVLSTNKKAVLKYVN